MDRKKGIMMNEEIINFNEIINNTFKNISVQDVKKARNIYNAWEKVLLRIKSNTNPNEGKKLAEHTRIIDFKNGILLIEADHPGWINIIQMRKKYILKGLEMEIPELEIKNFAVKLKGTRGELTDVESYKPEETRQQIEKRAMEEQKQMNYDVGGVNSFNLSKKTELPPELASIFDDLRENMKKENSLDQL